MNLSFRKIALVSIIAMVSGLYGLGIYTTSANSEDLQSVKSTAQNYNFEGMVSLNNCSGSLVRFENSKDSDPAMVLTNGHCNIPEENWITEPARYIYRSNNTTRINLLDSSARIVAELQADQIIYSTMMKTDITLYRLNTSFEEILKKYGVHALTLSSKPPQVNTPIEIISGFWKTGFSCNIEAFIPHLIEDKWIWDDSIRYSTPGCEVLPGTSGSPIIQKDTRTVIGINNTTNENGEKCTLNNPCEIDVTGNITYKPGYSYGQQTYWITTCLTPGNEFDLSIPGCKLWPH